ncbi:hypothetical protein GMA19_03057 [Paenibacillus polymyxa E681]|uniref:hypothetical protein n=1 Tax=Paenibacillus polymyxa TaxID=1406 RepID=UPI0001E31CBE|nr:hypothetical protein [Paenibacillus polymyxa]ADM70864.1 hypothetical protein PPE_03041 [Paenibacillus polymyxa E681]QNV57886.1 hypothetical protein GE561_03057 [Paenibacillus polymyxa E681]QNV62723.1 hypothetical protein GMA19_03057 [Paenibacillus polymyxa E681]
MTDKPDWEKRMDYWILEAEKEKKRADGVEKRLYFLETENEILKNNIKVLVDTQKESESLIQQKDAEICRTPRPLDEWGEDHGAVLWWKFPIDEPPYCGTPLDADWPDYHTHWTPITIPVLREEQQ